MTPDFVKEYVAALLAEAGLTNMPADFKEQYTNQVSEEVQRRVGLVVLGELKAKDAEAITQLVDSSDQDAVANFLKTHSKNYEATVAQALEKFRADFLQSLGAIKKSVKTAAKAS